MQFSRRIFARQLVAFAAAWPGSSSLLAALADGERWGIAKAQSGPDRPLPKAPHSTGHHHGDGAHAPAVATVPRPLQLAALARFVDSLPVPAVASPVGTRLDPQSGRPVPLYDVAMREVRVKLHRDIPETRVFAYGGTFPGPTFEVQNGQPMLVTWRNELPDQHLFAIDHSLCGAGVELPRVRAIVHVHGARVPPESDGYPSEWYAPGGSATVRYPNRQDAATLWYHDHAMGIERLNQYAGLFGMFLVRDAVEARLGLPSGRFEIPLMLCDRTIDADGQLRYPTSGDPEGPWVPEVYGDAQLVNGKLFPYLDVEPRRYRFRVCNAANGRFYYLSLGEDITFHQVGSDQGLLSAPVPLKSIPLAPGERADLVVDFSGQRGTRITLRSQALELMQFRVADEAPPAQAPLPQRLRRVPRLPASAAVRTRKLTLDEYEHPKTHRMLMLLNGSYWHDPVTERVELDSVEIWDLLNMTEDTHPIHLHLVRFQLVHRQAFDLDEYGTTGKLNLVGAPVPPAAGEAGWKDTVRVEPGSIARIIVRFEGYAGRYVWHCHVLEHAANEMMRPFEVLPRRKRPTHA